MKSDLADCVCAVEQGSNGESKPLKFLQGSDYVLTYEDQDGDLMLVGDVPWK